MNKINLGVFSELANNKADRDLRNVDLTKTDIVIEYQEPTEENNYTWYRLYASGWIEQGGIINSNTTSILLLVRMEDNSYNTIISYYKTNSSESPMAGHLSTNEQTTNSFTTKSSGYTRVWRVSGKADMTGHEIISSKAEQEEFEHRVIAFQKPTTENSYTWYRKYADGWVETGGVNNDSTLAGVAATITLPVEMADTNYTIMAAKNTDDTTATYGWGLRIVKSDKTVNSFKVRPDSDGGFFWRVEGMYATEE